MTTQTLNGTKTHTPAPTLVELIEQLKEAKKKTADAAKVEQAKAKILATKTAAYNEAHLAHTRALDALEAAENAEMVLVSAMLELMAPVARP